MKQLYYVIRTLMRGRGSNVIKVVSLGLGLTMSILLFARVAYEQSFDKCFRDYDNLYQVYSIFTMGGKQLPAQQQNCYPLAGAILENFSEQVESATMYIDWWRNPLYVDDKPFGGYKVVADSLFFSTMGIEVLSGNPARDLVQPDVIFLSESLARQMFGEEDPVGKSVVFSKQFSLTVRGVYTDIPANATVRPEAVISLPSLDNRELFNREWGGGDSWRAFIRFRPGADKQEVNARLDAMVQKYLPDEYKQATGYTAFVKPIRDVYRNQDDVKRMRNIMTILGLTILFIATLNYVLISISSLSYRAKGIGVHKCNGAGSTRILSMFLWETAFVIVGALLLMGLLLVNFREFFEDTIAVKLSDLFAWNRIWAPLSVVALLFIIGGVLPGWMFARIPVTQVFRRYTEGKKGWKRPLLFVQFAGVAFICGLMYVVLMQYHYVMNKDLGYNPERVVIATAHFQPEADNAYAYNFFRDLPYVEAVSSANSAPSDGYSGMMITDDNGKSLFSARFANFQDNYIDMMGMKLKTGAQGLISEQGATVNETFARRMNWGNDAVGKMLNNYGVKVTAVLQDYHIENFMQEKQPLFIQSSPGMKSFIHIRLKEPFAQNLTKLNEEVKTAFADKVIEFHSLEQAIKDSYNSVRVFGNATMLAAVTMFFVMLMGLIGYTTDEVRRRSKEIAIRKVNGSEASGILEMLVKDVLYVAVGAVVVGVVASWYVNSLWMEQFSERLPISWAAYVLIALGNLAVIVACVLWKSWRIANENPVNSIKSE